MQTLDLAAALLPILVGSAGAVSGQRLWMRARVATQDIDENAWIGNYGIMFPALSIALACGVWACLRLGRAETGVFYSRLADGLTLPVLVAIVVGCLAAAPLAGRRALQSITKSPASLRGVRGARLLGFAGLFCALVLGLCVFRTSQAQLIVSRSDICYETFWAVRTCVDSAHRYRVVEFGRRGGLAGAARKSPHIVIAGRTGRIDTFYATKGRDREFRRALAAVFSDPWEKRDLHRVGLRGETLSGLEGIP